MLIFFHSCLFSSSSSLSLDFWRLTTEAVCPASAGRRSFLSLFAEHRSFLSLSTEVFYRFYLPSLWLIIELPCRSWLFTEDVSILDWASNLSVTFVWAQHRISVSLLAEHRIILLLLRTHRNFLSLLIGRIFPCLLPSSLVDWAQCFPVILE